MEIEANEATSVSEGDFLDGYHEIFKFFSLGTKSLLYRGPACAMKANKFFFQSIELQKKENILSMRLSCVDTIGFTRMIGDGLGD